MGAGFIITITLLGALLGLFARQALAVTEEENVTGGIEPEETTHHSQAM